MTPVPGVGTVGAKLLENVGSFKNLNVNGQNAKTAATVACDTVRSVCKPVDDWNGRTQSYRGSSFTGGSTQMAWLRPTVINTTSQPGLLGSVDSARDVAALMSGTEPNAVN